jgi:hypothetical protein
MLLPPAVREAVRTKRERNLIILITSFIYSIYDVTAAEGGLLGAP